VNLTLIPLLIAALLLASGDPGVDTVQLILSGEHEVTEHAGALIVGESTVTIPAGARVPGPVYVIGGELQVVGEVVGDVTQLAGTVRVEAGAAVEGELQHVAGTLIVDGDDIGRRTSLDLTGSGSTAPGSGFLPGLSLTVLLAGVGYLLARRKPKDLANVSTAARAHPVVSLTVGTLAFLTTISLLVFMAFTLVLIPITILGLMVGLLTLFYGLIGWGYLIGSLLPVHHRGFATALGVLVLVVGLVLVSMIPVVGEPMIAEVVLAGVGAVLVTYYGVAPFQPDLLPD